MLKIIFYLWSLEFGALLIIGTLALGFYRYVCLDIFIKIPVLASITASEELP